MILVARGFLDSAKIQRLSERLRCGFELYMESRMGELMCSASLAHHGLFDSVKMMALRDFDLSSVPAKYLASLASRVTGILRIQNVIGCDLVSILTSLKCEFLIIGGQNLGRKETRALVWAMDAVVEEVELHREVTLDMEALAEYSAEGVCRAVRLYHGTAIRYRKDLRIWANNRNWTVVMDEFGMFRHGRREEEMFKCIK